MHSCSMDPSNDKTCIQSAVTRVLALMAINKRRGELQFDDWIG